MIKQARVFIKGDVTGVGFRGWVRMLAKQAHITGIIRNVFNNPAEFGPHGGVEAIFQGEEEAVKDMIEHVQDGPSMARVEDVSFHYEEPTEIYEEFSVLKSLSFSHHE